MTMEPSDDPAHLLVRVAIDLNVRTGTGGQLTFTGFEDVLDGSPVPEVGTSVIACEPESGVQAPGIVVHRDEDRRLLYVAVAWLELQDMPDPDGSHGDD